MTRSYNSVQSGSLSVSCTMPPFQGCEEPSGLGLLAKYASQVATTEHLANKKPGVIHGSNCGSSSGPTSCVMGPGTNTNKSPENGLQPPAGGGGGGAITVGNGHASEELEEGSKVIKTSSGDAAVTSDQEVTSSAHKRKPGRPKKHSPVQSKEATGMETFLTKCRSNKDLSTTEIFCYCSFYLLLNCFLETIVAKKPKPLNFLNRDASLSCLIKPKQQSKPNEVIASKSGTNRPEVKHSFLEDEAWFRRRSERIFLNEPRINPGNHNLMVESISHKKSPVSFSATSYPKSLFDDNMTTSSSLWKSKNDDCHKVRKKSHKP